MKKFDELTSISFLKDVVKTFYEKIYSHEWIGKYFAEIPQEQIEAQQVDFMVGALGGPKNYAGQLPTTAHNAMMITEQLFDLREELLLESLEEHKASRELIERWLKIDEAFRHKIVKKKISECVKNYATEEILDFPNPMKKVS
jgi:hemoglobin